MPPKSSVLAAWNLSPCFSHVSLLLSPLPTPAPRWLASAKALSAQWHGRLPSDTLREGRTCVRAAAALCTVQARGSWAARPARKSLACAVVWVAFLSA